MYKIIRGSGFVEKGTPYLIVTANNAEYIDLEMFIFAVNLEDPQVVF